MAKKILRPGPNGSYYTQSADRIEHYFGLSAQRRHLTVEVPDAALTGLEAWKSWCCGMSVQIINKRLHSGAHRLRQRAKGYSATSGSGAIIASKTGTTFTPQVTSVATQGIALSLMQSRYGFSRSTASRIRQRGQQVGGYEVQRALRIVTVQVAGVWRAMLSAELGAARYMWPGVHFFRHNGYVAEEVPAMICFEKKAHFLWKNSRKN